MKAMSEAAARIAGDVNQQAASELARRLWEERREMQRQLAALERELARRDAAASMDYEIRRGRMVPTWI